jgi:hypothetical protein
VRFAWSIPQKSLPAKSPLSSKRLTYNVSNFEVLCRVLYPSFGSPTVLHHVSPQIQSPCKIRNVVLTLQRFEFSTSLEPIFDPRGPKMAPKFVPNRFEISDLLVWALRVCFSALELLLVFVSASLAVVRTFIFHWKTQCFLRFFYFAIDRARTTSRCFFTLPGLQKSTKN